MKKEIEEISDFVHEHLMKTGREKSHDVWGPKYRWEHTLRVANWACHLATEEKADIKKCLVSALFHDVSHFTSEDYRKHGIRSAETAKEFLLKKSYPEDFVEDVAYAVRSHVGEHNPRTVEAKILQDSDTLDRFGFFRILLFGKKSELLDLEKVKDKVESLLEYLKKVERGDYGQMWTETGKTKVTELLNIYEKVLDGILEELQNTKLPEI
jgi:putative nucleotidyltransferase with HDIG domain